MEKYDVPVAYGQHTNAEINSQIAESNALLDDILSIQPAKSAGGGQSEEKTRQMALLTGLKEKLPIPMSIITVKIKNQKLGENPMITVLIQELQRYNTLLDIIANSLEELFKGIDGKTVITDKLEKMMKDLDNNKVPDSWSNSYFSLKSLGSWYTDLQNRYEFFSEWATKSFPIVYSIGYFTYPIGFTTSLLQNFSRKPGGPAIDLLSFDFIVKNDSIEDLRETPAKDGAYITGLYLEGANWNKDRQFLCEP